MTDGQIARLPDLGWFWGVNAHIEVNAVLWFCQHNFSCLQPCFGRDLDNKFGLAISFSVFKLFYLIFELFYLQCSFEALGQTLVSGPTPALEQGWLFVQHGQQEQTLLVWYFLYNFSVKTLSAPSTSTACTQTLQVSAFLKLRLFSWSPELPKVSACTYHPFPAITPPASPRNGPYNPTGGMAAPVLMSGWVRQEQTQEYKAGHPCQQSLAPH